MKTSTGFVYFIKAGDDGPVKIGWSENPDMRLAQLQSAHHETLSVLAKFPGGRDVEAEVHQQLHDLRLRGEWFRDEPALRQAIVHLQTRGLLRPLGLPVGARAAHLTHMREGWETVVREARSEDEAAEIFSEVGRKMFRASLECSRGEVAA